MTRTPHPRRTFALGLATALVLAAAVAACSSGGALGSARQKAIGAITNGTWDCTPGKKGDHLTIEASKDGSFEITSKEHAEEGPAVGSWKVVDKKVSLSIGLAKDKELVDVRGFDDLKAKAGTITVQDPKDADNKATFEVDLKGTDTVTITPDAASSKEFPSGTWTCERQ
ncbi:hypothetical protein KSP35_22010 [Aquihabitans sp. G128]|uniref:hypothetical protein n=1 Tax=Aquihabitans sp. G128 TaxID=2849779 RepID=UPI001C228735|nr:hypothetical protein [Aquihabitans sp. G128]QXC60957.1 hypothetical protein KSP35_22010 [Aquihabitans sp. G128]